ncbi:transposase, partial [Allomesorhizobium alhagi]
RLKVSPPRSHRRWSGEAKARLIEASLAPGANVSAIAREAGLAPSQLFGWRRKALKGDAENRRGGEGRLGFVEIATTAAQIEIEVAGVIIRAGADIGQDQLVKIVRAVKSA